MTTRRPDGPGITRDLIDDPDQLVERVARRVAARIYRHAWDDLPAGSHVECFALARNAIADVRAAEADQLGERDVQYEQESETRFEYGVELDVPRFGRWVQRRNDLKSAALYAQRINAGKVMRRQIVVGPWQAYDTADLDPEEIES